ncbi:MAG: Maf family protein [Acetobacter sp.]|jgi:septum formation protein|nr:Maf family protein [Acetobacter sp.]MCH4061446.1 Maf family protein [Acetobacter sp.]MCI1294078.1 Maf family protein [Acetobacter sp.]MCI1320703.1 Maf family protein [Acetobacter sp.]MCI1374003.1 Maf family protein [Acetobacter sp.]
MNALPLVLKGNGLQTSTALILASTSSARREIMRSAGLQFTAMGAGIDESDIKNNGQLNGEDADVVALTLAQAKADAVWRQATGMARTSWVIGADQMLSCEGEWFDKPSSLSDARSQLMKLRNRTHILHSAVVLMRDGVCLWRHVSRSELTMRAFSDEFLDCYLETEGEACLESVGAYRLEGMGIHLFSSVHGDQSAILGLPLLPLLAALRQENLLLE